MAFVNTDCPVITLTTDFGLEDNYIGIVKGMITGLNQLVNVIDITNNISPYNINSASYLLSTSYYNFPPGTIHIGIVDPGVGTKRNAVLVETDNYYFVGPDNGIFSFLKKNEIKRIILLNKKKYFLHNISSTFHGRDIFAPVAGYLSLGIDPKEFGPEIKTIMRTKESNTRKTKNGWIGAVIHIDRFGNLVTSFKADSLPSSPFTIFLNEQKVGILRQTFDSVLKGKPVGYVNSLGFLEIAINQGSAREYFSVDNPSKTKILIAPSATGN